MNGQARIGRGGQALRIAMWGGAALLMAAAAAAAKLGEGMEWSAADFVLVASILLAACGLFELLMRKTDSWAYRAGVAVAVGSAVLLFLAAGAVGIVGSDDEPANLLFLGVIAFAAAGALAARFRPGGMAPAMGLTAAAQVLAGTVALLLVADVPGFLLGTALFTPLWLLSAWLFRRVEQS